MQRGKEGCRRFQILWSLPHKLPEGQLADKQLHRFLMETDFPKCNCPWSVRLRFLRATHSGSAFAGCLSGLLFPPVDFSPSCLLGTSHS